MPAGCTRGALQTEAVPAASQPDESRQLTPAVRVSLPQADQRVDNAMKGFVLTSSGLAALLPASSAAAEAQPRPCSSEDVGRVFLANAGCSGAHLLLAEVLDQVVQQGVVKVLPPQEGVAIGGLDLKHAAGHLQDGHIKGAASQVIHRKQALLRRANEAAYDARLVGEQTGRCHALRCRSSV